MFAVILQKQPCWELNLGKSEATEARQSQGPCPSGQVRVGFVVNSSGFGSVRHFMAFHEGLGSFGGFQRGILG